MIGDAGKMAEGIEDMPYRAVMGKSARDFFWGSNATGYSFITGFDVRTPMHLHLRPSEADDIEDPLRGLLAGGPNPGQQDGCTTYPSSVPDESYTDTVCSYASNEIAINRNAAAAYLAGALDAVLRENK